MKVKIGMTVRGAIDSGAVVAMSYCWCIYQNAKGEEIPELWRDVSVVASGPYAPESTITEKEV